MNGQFGISSRVFLWNADLVRNAATNVALYKRLRQVIMGADVYHLTVQPRSLSEIDFSCRRGASEDYSQVLVY
jgi:hypothetical protein